MNNSALFIEENNDDNRDSRIKEEEAKIIRIIEALRKVQETKAWGTLKSEIFDKLSVSLERDLKAEAKKEDPDPKRLNRLAGELKWADKYSDLFKLEIIYRTQLQNIRIQLNGKKSE